MVCYHVTQVWSTFIDHVVAMVDKSTTTTQKHCVDVVATLMESSGKPPYVRTGAHICYGTICILLIILHITSPKHLWMVIIWSHSSTSRICVTPYPCPFKRSDLSKDHSLLRRHPLIFQAQNVSFLWKLAIPPAFREWKNEHHLKIYVIALTLLLNLNSWFLTVVLL